MLHRRDIFVVCLLVWLPAVTAAQSADNLWFVRGGITPAFILPTNPFGVHAEASADPIGMAPNVTIEIGRRTDGNSGWHELYGMPSYGIGFSLVRLPRAGENSRPVEAYTFFSWPFARLTERVQVTTDFGMGVSWRWKRMYDKDEGYENVLGSDVNARVN